MVLVRSGSLPIVAVNLDRWLRRRQTRDGLGDPAATGPAAPRWSDAPSIQAARSRKMEGVNAIVDTTRDDGCSHGVSASQPTDRLRMSEATPDRIKPFYAVPEALAEEILFQSQTAELKQGGKVFKGRFQIIQVWATMSLRLVFWTGSAREITFGDVEVKAAGTRWPIRFFVIGIAYDRIWGSMTEPIEIGTDHKLERVTFHLPNYPDLSTDAAFHDTITEGGNQVTFVWSEVVLEDDRWRITLQPHRNIRSLEQRARINQSTVLSGVGEIRQRSGEEFKRKDIPPVLEALRSIPVILVGRVDAASLCSRLQFRCRKELAVVLTGGSRLPLGPAGVAR